MASLMQHPKSFSRAVATDGQCDDSTHVNNLKKEIEVAKKLRESIFIDRNIFSSFNYRDQSLKCYEKLKSIGNKIESDELALERNRVLTVAEEYERLHPSAMTTYEHCLICLDRNINLDDYRTFARLPCCLNRICMECHVPGKFKCCPLCKKEFPTTDKEKFKLIERNAEAGDSWSMNWVSRKCVSGLCVSILCGTKIDRNNYVLDRNAALHWLTRAVEENSSIQSSYDLGQLYLSCWFDGISNEEADEKARCYFKTALVKGFQPAIAKMGENYYLTKNYDEAIRYSTVALSKDMNIKHPETIKCAYILGDSFMHGLGGLKQSYDRSIYYLRNAATKTKHQTDGQDMVQTILDHGEQDLASTDKLIWLLRSQRELALALTEQNFEQYNDPYLYVPAGYSCVPQILYWKRKCVDTMNRCDVATQSAELKSWWLQNIHDTEEKLKSFCNCCNIRSNDELVLKSCIRCKAAWYCSKKCQRKHWRDGHKNDCFKM